MKQCNYAERFVLPLDGDDTSTFYTPSELVITVGYTRLVIGGRGPYLEFDDTCIVTENIHVPEDQRHRLGNDAFFYDEYRSTCSSNVKVYHQKNLVSYADYKVGLWYIDPFELKTEDFESLFLPLHEEPTMIEATQDREERLWKVISRT